MDEHELVRRAIDGDESAYRTLVEKYEGRLLTMARRLTGDTHRAEDVVQDALLKAYARLRSFHFRSSFYTWIYSISVNMSLNFLKKRGRQRKLSLDDMDSGVQFTDEYLEATAGKTPVQEANILELQERLNMAMQQLSDDHRAVVTMFDIQGMPHAEISKILGVSEGTIRSRLFYAHRQLQTYLEEFRK